MNRVKIVVPRRKVFISLLFIVPLGFGSKFYRGTGEWWLNNYAGGMLYEVFWCLVAVFIWPRVSGFSVAILVFGITSFLEFLQLWHPPLLEAVRSTFIGRTLIGTSFTWWDFPYYIIGCCVGWIWIRLLKRSV